MQGASSGRPPSTSHITMHSQSWEVGTGPPRAAIDNMDTSADHLGLTEGSLIPAARPCLKVQLARILAFAQTSCPSAAENAEKRVTST